MLLLDKNGAFDIAASLAAQVGQPEGAWPEEKTCALKKGKEGSLG